MLFLCTPKITFGEAGIPGWAVVWFVNFLYFILIYPFFYELFIILHRKGKITAETMKRITYESIFCSGIFGAYPFYFTFSFIGMIFSKGHYKPLERGLLLLYYFTPTFLILSLGIFVKNLLYGGVWNLIFAYSTENLAFFLPVFIFLLFLFWIYHKLTIQNE